MEMINVYLPLVTIYVFITVLHDKVVISKHFFGADDYSFNNLYFPLSKFAFPPKQFIKSEYKGYYFTFRIISKLIAISRFFGVIFILIVLLGNILEMF